MRKKIQIINSTNLGYQDIGFMIDEIRKHGKIDTIYFGKIDYTKFKLNKKTYLIQTKYMKNYVSFDIAEIGEGK